MLLQAKNRSTEEVRTPIRVPAYKPTQAEPVESATPTGTPPQWKRLPALAEKMELVNIYDTNGFLISNQR